MENAVCLHVPGPHWLTVNDPIADGVEAEYRAALSGSVPEAMDDARFGAAMAAACLVFAIIRDLRPTHAALAGPAHAASGNPHLRQRVTAP